jgi:indole-3-glycerol phosphate synthase
MGRVPDGTAHARTMRAMTSFLDQLLADAADRVAAARVVEPLASLRDRAGAVDVPADLHAALSGAGVAVIAEVKRASPSRGDLAPDLDAVAQARAYAAGGAHAVSVLTEPDRFRGTLDDLRGVSALGVPALRKDFTVDAYQVWEARAHGASAVLLIVAALDDDRLAELHAEATAAGLTALVEVHDEDELDRAVGVGARVIGVNARDLRTFDVDRGAFARLRPAIPDGVVAVAESGIRGPDDVVRARGLGADAVLVGESLVTAADPTTATAALVTAGRAATEEPIA